ncbi:DUF378 domain-containing protein [Clostridium sp. CX1]|uniref:DUF378 domain-containing protein n=1 Tax=Clostridium tanneri TaxID=3037988 RepID=A0ABU4JS66_9CLOT|nr:MULTISPECIES: DUF378 domain-containing protein [unclassified Clostridium]MCT8976793.1 DUF378 domain-containing protein [Clostridium sp. CX1]MDW8800998.1 DUF378 domain-containing protein [Clostridium sp. A1-XYC3]
MYKLKLIDKISLVLAIIGAINWGLIGLFNLNLVGVLFGEPANLIGRLVYILIGVSGANLLMLLIKTKQSFKQ